MCLLWLNFIKISIMHVHNTLSLKCFKEYEDQNKYFIQNYIKRLVFNQKNNLPMKQTRQN